MLTITLFFSHLFVECICIVSLGRVLVEFICGYFICFGCDVRYDAGVIHKFLPKSCVVGDGESLSRVVYRARLVMCVSWFGWFGFMVYQPLEVI